MPTNYQLILCSCPDTATAQQIAQHLIQSQLAACVTILPSVTSVYQWQGVIETAQEQMLLIKTCARHYPAIETEIKQLHPYQVPEIIAVCLENALPDYLHWINSCVLPA